MESFDGQALTTVSLASAVPMPPSRREEVRQTALLRVAKVIAGDEQQLCMVRNISSAGAMVRLHGPLPPGTQIRIELTPDCPIAASVIWNEKGYTGIAFDARVDVFTALRGDRAAGRHRRVARTPRLCVSSPARFCTEEDESGVTLCNISLEGAKVTTERELGFDSEAALFVDGLPPMTGRVRWCSGGFAGIQFEMPLQIDVLAGWIGQGAR